ncbi:hypothetical protein [Tardiphaga robiniae]|uniref:Uncharacterized protein n=1 Tax=Tardiphaga robiniae TaxID=943830 RepID=A0A163YTW9_9BRAD|nr:hypothetical protein [Tardiphaga robiniae]KZD22569.1 hypothetical protein A4A58_29260 [Tardiphaga robiniae]
MSEEQWLFDIYISDGALAPEVSLRQALRSNAQWGPADEFVRRSRPSKAMPSIDEVEAGVGCLRKH